MPEGHFTIPTRIYLTLGQRARLRHLLEREDRDLDEWLTELATAHLDVLPEPPPVAAQPSGTEAVAALRQRRAELRRLRPKLNDPYNAPPVWLVQMVADLEAEVRRLESVSGGQ